MALRNILVHLDSSPRTAERLQLATKLAARQEARLIGVFAQRSAAHRIGIPAPWPSEEYAAGSEASRKVFVAATRNTPNADWLDLNCGGEQKILHEMTDLARHFDLVIAGQDQEGVTYKAPADLAEQLIMESGRPVLVVPYVGSYSDAGHRPLIAWNDTRSAARALNDSLNVLVPGCEATLISFSQATSPPPVTVDRIIGHLSLHGITAKSDHMAILDLGVMDMLLNRAAEHGSDLLVAGAFGGEGSIFGRGAGTRFLLRHMTLPVLFSH